MCYEAPSTREASGLCGWWRNHHRHPRQRNNWGVNQGIQIAGSIPPPWRNGFVPRYTWWGPTWTNATWGRPEGSANWGTPGTIVNWGTTGAGVNWGRTVLPIRQPDHSVWSFPTGNLTWSPNRNGYNYWFPMATQTLPFDGYPKLAPYVALNPIQPDMPLLLWDVRQHHSTTRLTTGAHISTSLGPAMNALATDIPVSIIEIAIRTCFIAHPWGVVRVERAGGVRVTDILHAVYEWLQTPITPAEMERFSPAAVDAIHSFFRERARWSPALDGWERQQGPRRIDCLGENRRWMGLSYSPSGQGMQLVLNLQTVPRAA